MKSNFKNEEELTQIIEGLLSHMESKLVYKNSPHNEIHEYYNNWFKQIKRGI